MYSSNKEQVKSHYLHLTTFTISQQQSEQPGDFPRSSCLDKWAMSCSTPSVVKYARVVFSSEEDTTGHNLASDKTKNAPQWRQSQKLPQGSQ